MFTPQTTRRAQREVERLERIAYLQEMERKTKEIEEGRCDWLNELMQSDNKPNLIVGSEEITYEFPDGTAYTHYFDAD